MYTHTHTHTQTHTNTHARTRTHTHTQYGRTAQPRSACETRGTVQVMAAARASLHRRAERPRHRAADGRCGPRVPRPCAVAAAGNGAEGIVNTVAMRSVVSLSAPPAVALAEIMRWRSAQVATEGVLNEPTATCFTVLTKDRCGVAGRLTHNATRRTKARGRLRDGGGMQEALAAEGRGCGAAAVARVPTGEVGRAR